MKALNIKENPKCYISSADLKKAEAKKEAESKRKEYNNYNYGKGKGGGKNRTDEGNQSGGGKDGFRPDAPYRTYQTRSAYNDDERSFDTANNPSRF